MCRDATHTRHQARTLRSRRPARRGRHGRGVSRPRHAPWPRRRHQGATAAPEFEPGGPHALRARGEDHLELEPPEHLHVVRHRPRGGHRLPRHGAGGGRNPGPAPGEGPAGFVGGAETRGAGGRCARPCAPRRGDPPGPEARERDADEEWREAHGLWPRARDRAGGACGRQRDHAGGHDHVAHHRGPADGGRNDHRHVPVHVAGAARGKRGRRAQRHLGARLRALRDGLRAPRVRGREPGVADRRHHERGTAAAVRDGADGPARTRSARPAVSRARSRRPLAERARPGPRAGDAGLAVQRIARAAARCRRPPRPVRRCARGLGDFGDPDRAVAGGWCMDGACARRRPRPARGVHHPAAQGIRVQHRLGAHGVVPGRRADRLCRRGLAGRDLTVGALARLG